MHAFTSPRGHAAQLSSREPNHPSVMTSSEQRTTHNTAVWQHRSTQHATLAAFQRAAPSTAVDTIRACCRCRVLGLIPSRTPYPTRTPHMDDDDPRRLTPSASPAECTHGRSSSTTVWTSGILHRGAVCTRWVLRGVAHMCALYSVGAVTVQGEHPVLHGVLHRSFLRCCGGMPRPRASVQPRVTLHGNPSACHQHPRFLLSCP